MTQSFTTLLCCATCCIATIRGASARQAEEVRIHEISANKTQTREIDDTAPRPLQPRLRIGGYGEPVIQRMFYRDNVARYNYARNYKHMNHGRFDLPLVVFYMSYRFGRGWELSAEIETEIETGGEIALEQFWIEKSWAPAANLRMGHIIVPVGLTNMYNMPTEVFSVRHPEEETSLIPCPWHETGVSFRGNAGKWHYEAMCIVGLDAERFSNAEWVAGGSVSPCEFKIANRYASAVRVDNYSVKGLYMGLSGYFGFSAKNSLKYERYGDMNGAVSIGAFDAVYDDHHILARGNVLYGHLGDSHTISMVNKRLPSATPSPGTNVASDVWSWYAELGYDILSLFGRRRDKEDKLYAWAYYGYYNPMFKTANREESRCATGPATVLGAGINYSPMKGLVIKAEYQMRHFKSPYHNEPTIAIEIGYSGLFSR